MKSIAININTSIHLLKTTQFKDITLSFRFLGPIDAKTSTLRALLAEIMTDRNDIALTKIAMTQACDQLYGASLDVRNTGYGQSIVTEIRSRIVDPQYVLDHDLASNHFKWLKSMILTPLINQDTLNEAKKVVRLNLRRTLDQATRFTIQKLFETAGAGYSLGINSQGNIELIDEITVEDIKLFHHQMITQQRLDIFAIGNVDEDLMVHFIENSLFNQARIQSATLYKLPIRQTAVLKEIAYKQIEQTNVAVGYISQIGPSDTLYWALRIGLMMLGQLPSSLLFTEIREKHSLCYFIGANMVTFDGFIYVYTGIEDKNVELVEQLIDDQLQKIQTGKFLKSLMTSAKKMMHNSLIQLHDDPSGLINFMYQMKLINRFTDIEEIMSEIQSVTKDQITQALKLCQKHTIFIVRTEVNHEENN